MSGKRLLSHMKLLKIVLHITVILRPEFPTKACHIFTRNKVVKDNCKGIDATVHILEFGLILCYAKEISIQQVGKGEILMLME